MYVLLTCRVVCVLEPGLLWQVGEIQQFVRWGANPNTVDQAPTLPFYHTHTTLPPSY